MLRRSHKKSRAGCLECKRRHVKCDEQRPKCIICTLSERPCSYPPNPQQDQASSLAKQPTPPVADTLGVSAGPSNSVNSVDSAPGLPHVSHFSSAIEPDSAYAASADINFDHMELMIKFKVSDHYPDINHDLYDHSERLHLLSMLSAPYYLTEILALSARRLSIVEPDKAAKHLRYAVALQTRAVSLYNQYVSTVKIDNVNCVPIIQFASLLGRHLLIDMLARRETDLNLFLEHYLEFVRIHSGIKLIVHSAWPFLIDSGMKDFLMWAGSLNTAHGVGTECAPLRELISKTHDLDPETLEACHTTIRTLQVGFDLMCTQPPQNNRYWAIFAWSVAAPEAFTSLLAQRRPEALVFLAYFGILLHYSRDQWQVGTSGAYLITMISQHLGPAWSTYMSYPLSIISIDPLHS
ncbi:hypothetical protein QBC34DRAFT_136152 [Podospora aff. communis PSN243]|uniref:Zn(2)-C6 fungal-type domain-containing protein n=1 Tax=Podospora aff. communis PSN243 TaxID=3040156 RepID=A0AAV9H187_9PEZI|nr:hypothetical protein QBC34DRAFT_136152 [Podospora aff. communis PSN243]